MMSRSPCALVALCLFVTFAVGVAAQQPSAGPGKESGAEPTSARRNVLLLVADDLCAGVLGCYGGGEVTSPNLDRLAAGGVCFDHAYSQFPVCGPARVALLTSRYPGSFGMRGNGAAGRIVEALGDDRSMPQWFQDCGWSTSRVSKIFHMRVPGDITKGVAGDDHPASWQSTVNIQADEWFSAGAARALDTTRLRMEPERHYGLGFGTAFYEVRVPGAGAGQADHQAASAAIERLGQLAGDDQPFFLAVGFVRPHVPLVAPEACFEQHDPAAIQLPEQRDGDWDDIPTAGRSLHSGRLGLLGRDDRQREVIAAYRAAVTFMDLQVGRVLAELDRLGVAEDTLVVFTSDHGYHLGEHEFWQKLSLHEESVRVPLIVAGPGVAAGARVAGLVEHVDLWPTLGDHCGIATPEYVQGRSFAPLLGDPAAAGRADVHSQTDKGHLLRTADFAFMRWNDGSRELYDMRADPRQFENLAERPEHAELVERLLRRMLERRAAMAKRD